MPLQLTPETTHERAIQAKGGFEESNNNQELTGGAYALIQRPEGAGWSVRINYARSAILQPDLVLCENQQNMHQEEGIAILQVGYQPVAQVISLTFHNSFNGSGFLAPKRTVVPDPCPVETVANTGDCGDSRTHHYRDRGTNTRMARALMGTGALPRGLRATAIIGLSHALFLRRAGFGRRGLSFEGH